MKHTVRGVALALLTLVICGPALQAQDPYSDPEINEAIATLDQLITDCTAALADYRANGAADPRVIAQMELCIEKMETAYARLLDGSSFENEDEVRDYIKSFGEWLMPILNWIILHTEGDAKFFWRCVRDVVYLVFIKPFE